MYFRLYFVRLFLHKFCFDFSFTLFDFFKVSAPNGICFHF